VHRIIAHLRSNLVGWLALFVALGGTGYAAISIPRNSVGAAQIRNRSITPAKFNPKSIGGSVRAWAIVSSAGKVLAGSGRPHVSFVSSSPALFDITWSVHFPVRCATVANIDANSPATETIPISIPGGGTGTESIAAGYVSAVGSETGPTSRHSGTILTTFNQNGQPTALGFDVAVIC
jgi:hypothetical protein